jgi:hypothetical protein
MIGVEGGAFEENGSCGIEKRPIGDVGVAGDPANVRSTPVDVALLLCGREVIIIRVLLPQKDFYQILIFIVCIVLIMLVWRAALYVHSS